MRVNVDESALSEPRMRRVAKRLGLKHYEVLGRILHVWMLCYQRRSAVVDAIDIDIAAGDLDGFADALVAEELADSVEAGIYVRGVTDRIEFLDKQAEKGRKSGESRRNAAVANRGSSKPRTAPRTRVQPQHEQRLNRGSTDHRTYSPDLDLDLAPDLDLTEPAKTSPRAAVAADSPSSSDAIGPEGAGKGSDQPRSTPPVKLALVPDPEAKGKQPAQAPLEALTLAELLLGHVLMNHPTARLARAPEKTQQITAERWALTIDKMHRLDKHSWGEIEGMISWSQAHSFWRTVILGADNLRDKWDKMAAQRGRGAATSTPARGNAFDALDQAAADATAKEQKP